MFSKELRYIKVIKQNQWFILVVKTCEHVNEVNEK